MRKYQAKPDWGWGDAEHVPGQYSSRLLRQ